MQGQGPSEQLECGGWLVVWQPPGHLGINCQSKLDLSCTTFSIESQIKIYHLHDLFNNNNAFHGLVVQSISMITV